MENHKKFLDSVLWEDFKNLQNMPEVLTNYDNYFFALSNWVKQNTDSIGNEILSSFRLASILNIDYKAYLIFNPEISLDFETKRMFGRKPETVNSLLMRINDTLWDLVKQRSGKDCPRCKNDELNYIKVEILDIKEIKIILECDSCGWAENLDGTIYSEGLYIAYPTNKNDIQSFAQKS